jgi:hypothetical protein
MLIQFLQITSLKTEKKLKDEVGERPGAGQQADKRTKMFKVKVVKGGTQTDRVPPNVAHVNMDALTDAATESREADRE